MPARKNKIVDVRSYLVRSCKSLTSVAAGIYLLPTFASDSTYIHPPLVLRSSALDLDRSAEMIDQEDKLRNSWQSVFSDPWFDSDADRLSWHITEVENQLEDFKEIAQRIPSHTRSQVMHRYRRLIACCDVELFLCRQGLPQYLQAMADGCHIITGRGYVHVIFFGVVVFFY